MNLPASLAVFGGLLVLFVAAAAAGRVLACLGLRGWIAVLLPVGAVIVLPLAGARWISLHGSPVSGIIAAKSESLHIAEWGLEPDISHKLTLEIALRSGGQALRPWRARPPLPSHDRLMRSDRTTRPLPVDLQIDVDERLFDEVRQGQPIAMHLFRVGPLEVARLDAEPWWDLAPGALERALPRGSSAGPLLTASAEIRSVRTVREADAYSLFAPSGDGTDPATRHVVLAQPYDEVKLRFRTRRGAEILAVDRVDAGSAGRLEPGATITVAYPASRPRAARLARGTRTFSRRNAIEYWMPEIAAALTVLSLIAGTMAAWIQHRRKRQRPSP
jgi:hypothetical protein